MSKGIPNPLFDALAEIEGCVAGQITKSEGGRIARALKEIKEVCPDVTPEEILRRAGNYRVLMPHAQITARALSCWWSKLDKVSVPTPAPKVIRPMMR